MQRSLRALSASAKMTSNVHKVAASGFAEGTNDLYDRARPSYPAPALEYIHKSLPGRDLTILEPGSGTGIFSRLVLAPPAGYPSFSIRSLIGVEPSAGMRAAWDRGVARLPASATEGVDTRSVDGGFDDLSRAGVAKGTADAAIIAQAWHWCPDYEGALREIAAYLKPGGALVLIWNLEGSEPAWQQTLRDTFQPMDLGSPQYYRMGWKKMLETKAYKELFEPAEEEHVAWNMQMTEDSLVDRLFSKSYLTEANLNGEKRVQFEQKLRSVIRDAPDKEWIDKDAGTFKYNYTTDVYVFRKRT